jgi:hypothetical protein
VDADERVVEAGRVWIDREAWRKREDHVMKTCFGVMDIIIFISEAITTPLGCPSLFPPIIQPFL